MLTYYGRRRTGSFGPHLALLASDLSFDYVEVDKERGDQASVDLLALNPIGKIPVLVLDSGAALTETVAMMLHIGDLAPNAGLLPPPGTDARARVMRWLIFSVAEIYEPVLRYTYADRYTADPATDESVRAGARLQWDRGFEILEAAYAETGGPYLLGDSLSVADLYFPMFLAWHYDTPALLARSPNLAAMAKSVRALPRLAAEFTDQGYNEFDAL